MNLETTTISAVPDALPLNGTERIILDQNGQTRDAPVSAIVELVQPLLDALTPADIGAATAAQGVLAESAVQPAGLTKAAVGLGNVENTSDADKPISAATAAALAGKVGTGDSRLSDSRTPTSHKSSHANGGTDPLTPADIGAATEAQGVKAESAVQPAALNAALTATAAALAGKASTGSATTSGLTMATARLLGRTTAGVGEVEEIQVAGGSFANGTLTLSSLPSSLTADANGNLTFTARWIQSTNGAASAPAHALTGTWFTGGTATTTKPQLLIEPAGASSTNWSTAGTGLGVNAASGFTGDLLNLQANSASYARINVGQNNILFGASAGRFITNYTGCVVIGASAHSSIGDAGNEIVAIGNSALRYINIGNGSTQALSIGASSGGRIRAAGASVLLGGLAGQGSANFSARIQRTTCAGFEAGAGFDAVTLADNSLFGYRSGFAISSGNQNTFIGSGAGSTVTTGSNNIAIGFNAAVDSITASNQINIGGVYYHDRIEGSKRFTGNIGFFGATAVAQPAAVADAADNASAITQLNLVLARLRSLGLIAT